MSKGIIYPIRRTSNGVKIVADLHIHSKYSRATSKDMNLETLNCWGKIKGINILGTGDFTHPLWFKELKEKLAPTPESGFFKIRERKTLRRNNENWPLNREAKDEVRFVLSAEISCIYSKNNRTRKIHLLILAPNFKAVEKINAHLGWIGNLKADGRPILGLDAKELAKIVLNASPDCLIIPAHAWTPWFSVFGANSGFDSLEECFDEYAKYIYAIETGLSSDPAMNWRLSQLDKITLISNSDAHSPAKIGREANVLEIEPKKFSFMEMSKIIKEGQPKEFLYTIEFFPEEGKYHYDGHRNCQISFHPEKTKKYKKLCPKCGKSLTIGVMNRVTELADRAPDFKPKNAVPFKSLIPLEEIIAEALDMGVATKSVREIYKELINQLGSEFKVLLEAGASDIERFSRPEIAEGVMRVRQGRVKIEPGYDGEFGKIKIFSEKEKNNFSKQKSLF